MRKMKSKENWIVYRMILGDDAIKTICSGEELRHYDNKGDIEVRVSYYSEVKGKRVVIIKPGLGISEDDFTEEAMLKTLEEMIRVRG